jgi:hypothetical protein
MAAASNQVHPKSDPQCPIRLDSQGAENHAAITAETSTLHSTVLASSRSDAPEKAPSTAAAATNEPGLRDDVEGVETPNKGKKADLEPTDAPAPPRDAGTGPELDADAIAPTDSRPATEGPICMITLLLPTGHRHPYKIDDKYLAKRNVQIPGMMASGRPDPFSISVYTLKELILREWRSEWENKPSSPTGIRLIYFGKLLDDKDPLQSTNHRLPWCQPILTRPCRVQLWCRVSKCSAHVCATCVCNRR